MAVTTQNQLDAEKQADQKLGVAVLVGVMLILLWIVFKAIGKKKK